MVIDGPPAPDDADDRDGGDGGDGAPVVDAGELTGRQLTAIAEVVRLTVDHRIAVWLRGGWAMDFLIGEVTRPHVDVDWWCWAGDADRLVQLLHAAGYVDDPRVPPHSQRDLIRDGVELSFAMMDRDADGRLVVGGAGPWAGAPLPAGTLDGPLGRLGDLCCPVVSAAAQIEFKEMIPVWMPGRPRRAKDRVDIARLRALM